MSKYISFEASRISYTIMNDSFGILGESNFHDIMKMKNLHLKKWKAIVHQNNPLYFKINIEIPFKKTFSKEKGN